MGKNGCFDYAYNAQISVDADLQIIVAQHVSQNANDKQEVEPALQALKDTTDRLPEKLSADNGYWSVDNLQAPMLTLPPIKVKRPTKYLWIARIANWSRPASTTTKPITRLLKLRKPRPVGVEHFGCAYEFVNCHNQS